MGLGSIAGGLAGLGSILGGMGGKDSKAQAVGGYATLPDEVKKAYEETYLPGVLDYFDSPYHNTPMVRAEYLETDPQFMSRALQRTQEYSDAIGGLFSALDDGTGGGGGSSKKSSAKDSEQAAEMAYGMMMLGQLAGQGGMYATNINRPYQQLIQSGDKDRIQRVAKGIGRGVLGQGNMGGGVIDPQTGLAIDVSQLLYGGA